MVGIHALSAFEHGFVHLAYRMADSNPPRYSTRPASRAPARVGAPPSTRNFGDSSAAGVNRVPPRFNAGTQDGSGGDAGTGTKEVKIKTWGEAYVSLMLAWYMSPVSAVEERALVPRRRVPSETWLGELDWFVHKSQWTVYTWRDRAGHRQGDSLLLVLFVLRSQKKTLFEMITLPTMFEQALVRKTIYGVLMLLHVSPSSSFLSYVGVVPFSRCFDG